MVPLAYDPAPRASLAFARWLGRGNASHEFVGVRLRGAGHEAPANMAPEDSILNGLLELDPDHFTTTDGEAADFDGLIISRALDLGPAALIDETPLVSHLASVAGKPVIVVPDDLPDIGVSTGPVVIAAADEPHGELCKFARFVADSRGVDTMLLRIIGLAQLRAAKATPEALDEALAAQEATEATLLEHWAAKHGLGGAARRVLHGDLAYCIQFAARRADASLVVVGTDRDVVLDRLREPTPAVSLARFASTPVALVPRRRTRASSDAA